jgi:hypothetical protein
MRSQPRIFIYSILFTLLCVFPSLSIAADQPPPIAEEWMFTVKQGQMSDFLAAVKEHGAVRSEHGDPRSWEVYRATLADGLNRVAIRYCCFNWADADAYDQWNRENPAVVEHWFANAAPHVEKTEHFFEETDWPNSHWNNDGGPYRFFAVTEFKIKAGNALDFDDARDKMSQIAINQGWANEDRSWIWSEIIGGAPKVFLVVPHENYASMAGGEKSFFSFLVEHMGSEEAAQGLLNQFSASTWGSTFQLWEHLPGLSMAPSA